jgi:putative ABC transport system permease protein
MRTLPFILRLAWRDSRASRRRLLLFSSAIVLGIAALVAIGSLGANLDRAVDGQAKGLLGADLIVTSRNPFAAEMLAHARAQASAVAREQSFSSMVVFPDAGGATRLVNVRALEGGFPFFGEFTTEPETAPARLREGAPVAIVEETLLRQFEVPVGGRLRLGEAEFTVAGALRKLPGESTAFSATAAPRILIPAAALAATGLTERSVLVRHRLMLELPPGRTPEAVARSFRERFRADGLGFDTVAERRRSLGRALDNIEAYLGLVGFVALILGAIGVASAIHVHVRQKLATVAVLRCLGASAGQSFAVYLVQGVALGLAGALAGAALGVGLQLALPRLLADVVPFPVEFFVAWPAVARGIGAGVVLCLLFTLLPLLAVRRVPPLSALRSALAEAEGVGRDPWRLVVAGLIVLAIAGLAAWQTGGWREGLGFTAALGVALGILWLLAQATSWLARRAVPRRAPYVVRQGIANLHRPNNRTVLLLVSLGLGCALMLTLFLARSTLLRELASAGAGTRPNLLLFDIQDDQRDPLARALAAAGAPLLVEAPIVTMRLAALRGRPVEELLRVAPRGRPDEAEAVRDGRRGGEGARRPAGWTLRREYRTTFRETLGGAERLVAGEFTPRVPPGTEVVPISVEEGLLRDLGAALGDELTWDVQGVPVRSRITSVRAVEWRRFEPNFFVVFPAGVLEEAPKFHVMAVRTTDAAHAARVQRAVVAACPNVSAIDLALVLETVDSVLSRVGFVVEFMAAFTVLTGLVVLVGAVLTGRLQRVRETVLLRTLGASAAQLRRIQLVEYAILGSLAAVVGGALALGGNALVAHFVFRIPPAFPLPVLAAGIFTVAGATVVIGFLANRGIVRQPPLEVLREET